MNVREVRRHGDGWGVFDPNASRASAVEPTQAAAQQRACDILANQGGGEMRTEGAGLTPAPSVRYSAFFSGKDSKRSL